MQTEITLVGSLCCLKMKHKLLKCHLQSFASSDHFIPLQPHHLPLWEGVCVSSDSGKYKKMRVLALNLQEINAYMLISVKKIYQLSTQKEVKSFIQVNKEL